MVMSNNEELYRLWVLLAQVRDIVSKLRHRELERYNISPRRAAIFYAMDVIGASGEHVTPGRISRWLFLEPHSVSEHLRRMQEESLLKKIRTPQVKKQVIIELTDKGRKYYQNSAKRKSILKVISCLDEEERKQLWPLLQKLRQKALTELMIGHEKDDEFLAESAD